MDGAKSVTDTVEQCLIDRRSVWAEAFLKKDVDRIEMKILAIVGS